MSMHKLSAGSGYDYLTRQVAVQDVTEKGHTGLASYYTAQGETPGVWVGSGMGGIDGLGAGDVVTAEQMSSLFGSGRHPLAVQRRARLEGPGLTAGDYQAVSRLGAPYKVYAGDVSAFRVQVAAAIAELNHGAGLPGDWPVPVDVRARVRTQIAVGLFRAEYGREPADAREIAATIAKASRPKTTAVAGFDLTFSPVKSVSTLWAVAEPGTAAVIERAHQGAVADALAFIESHALFTRLGTNGVRQVDVGGLVAAAFTHRDSRAGDPDLHTHVAVANKVRTDDGRWRAIDARVLFKANVSASETYNTALEHHLRDALGVAFAPRPGTDPGKRPVREIVGVDPRLTERWSARRAAIQARRSELAQLFQGTHGRPPTPIESIQLAQRATLETREAKHDPRSLAEQRTTWATQAAQVLGSDRGVKAMVQQVLHPPPAGAARVDAAWMGAAADQVLEAMQSRRSTWQSWHVRAEAQRQVRGTDLPTHQVDRVVDLLVDQVLDARCVRVTSGQDGIGEPAELRRRDGSSVYTIAGADLFTSTTVLAAEQRIVARAGQHDGHIVPDPVVEVALLESAANGLALNAGQAALVRAMATSGARVQLGIAPAGSGKTTAMRALAGAWADGDGQVIGLAPSATAAAALGEQLGSATDTLAKLTWHLTAGDLSSAGDLPDWAARVGPTTLVIIDEAGTADTLSLDAAVEFAVARGASVRLVGDDQQLAAIGAGGVMRDIQATHGALNLRQLMRFADTGEGAASLALRDGRPEALGFYLDQGRVHVGDLATMTQAVFEAWRTDIGAGKDAIMLAPTKELVFELNQRAQAHHRAGAPPPHTPRLEPRLGVRLADGAIACPGDLVITRANDRRLRFAATDWVKNGDRWMVLSGHRDGSLRVRHQRNGRVITLPTNYVQQSTELGYACTVHTAQGVTADTGHTLMSGAESRQLAYTAATRGRQSNHLYLQVVGDGDPHSAIAPDSTHPPTATDLLMRVLARDDSPRSATTLGREQADPARLLGQATSRYLDALTVAAQDLVGTDVLDRLDACADTLVSGLSDQPAWPSLRAHLVLLGAHGQDPAALLQHAAGSRGLGTAVDPAAVLDWRLDDTGLRDAGPGPLPWVPGIPPAMFRHPAWGPYLAARAGLVTDLSAQVRQGATTGPAPAWAQPTHASPGDPLLGDIAVWRAAMQVNPADRRPTGHPQPGKAAALFQADLAQRVAGRHTPAVAEWGPLLEQVTGSVHRDDFAPLLAERLAAVSRAGLNARGLLGSALAEGALPDELASAALWWRISRHLSPAVAAQARGDQAPASNWTARLAQIVGDQRAAQIRASSWWPTLVATVDHGLARGWTLEDLLTAPSLDGSDVDPCQGLVWRISVRTDPPPAPEDLEPEPSGRWPEFDDAGEDLWTGADLPDHLAGDDPAPPGWLHNMEASPHLLDATDIINADAVGQDVVTGSALVQLGDQRAADAEDVEATLLFAALSRGGITALEATDAQIDRQVELAWEQDHSPVALTRLAEVNAAALGYYQAQLAGSWANTYLTGRLGQDLAGHPHLRPGYAPPGWTALVTHLRRRGVSDQEMTAAGVATLASTGRLIDRFRDRAVLPIIDHGQVLGFVGRRRPDLVDDDMAGPKYLNTSDTALFHKGAQLFGVIPELVAAGATPVVVEGPIDAAAVTLAGAGRYLGVAPLGTSMTEQQAAQLATLGRDPIVATDADLAGQLAAHRDFWLLAQHGMDPRAATLPDGTDPAQILTTHGAPALVDILDHARPLSQVLLDERLANLPQAAALREAAAVMAAANPGRWDTATVAVADHLHLPLAQVRGELAAAARNWSADPRTTTGDQLSKISDTRRRVAQRPVLTPADRWHNLGNQLDERLVRQGDWPALASMLDQAQAAGLNVPTLTRNLVHAEPLGELPAQDLRYRLVAQLPIQDPPTNPPAPSTPTRSGAEHNRRQARPPAQPGGGPRR